MTAQPNETALLRCPCCHGRKNVMGMGGMLKQCGNCKGIGWVEEEPIVVVKRAYNRAKKVTDATEESPKEPVDIES